ncbi:hypothetical protein [Rhodopila globiformis]|uniref:Uncharacterized protein n=1 Tax=Rhodopila globiformis TaxID=1071 RepID=A0A2S6NPF3_RHOGL|nr:hypothetical protein [Rhodopila globiformis]PPQ40838.1 hypothetical protein CCS01_00210 [Rhodopila globiformis]
MTDTSTTTTDCLFDTILGFLLPFFLLGAHGDRALATAAIRDLIQAYHVSTVTELDLAGRIVGFSVVAMDNLRLSMRPDLSDSLVLRYRCNAVTLSRSADQAQAMLEALQAGCPVHRDVPRPSVAPAPPAPKPREAARPPVAAAATKPPAATAATKPPAAGIAALPQDIEAMQREARAMLAGFSRNSLLGSAIPLVPDPATLAAAAAREAVSQALRPPAA